MDYYIKTERLELRLPCIEDSKALYTIMRNDTLTQFLTWSPHESEEITKTLIKSLIVAQKSGRAYHWCVCLNKIPIGLVSLIDVKRKVRLWTLNRAELSYLIDPKHQGKGYATEASRAIIEFGLKELKLHKVIVAHSDKNIESKRICEKLIFAQYAHVPDAFYKEDKWHDLIWYERISK